MPTKDIIQFLSELSENNNREWFAENKHRYELTKAMFERLITELITKIGRFNEEVRHLDARDCVFRIYRDTRFSADKTPYKTHYGAFIAAGGGRKSVRGGYYLHLDPAGSFIAVGVWCPPNDLLKALRQTIYENIDEFLEIINEQSFKTHYENGFFMQDKLKTAPKGFPKDFPEIELLKLKHYMVEKKLNEDLLHSPEFIDKVSEMALAAHPLSVFLNYTVDEAMNEKE